ncbi:MAG: hypothetical protein FWC27_15050 [Firmicutes bacterium]|nr:hypothetical protein [Bacillota bacterium]
MYAYEFQADVHGGFIDIPEQYRRKIRGNAKIIVMMESEAANAPGADKELLFDALCIPTKGFKFNREEANER